MLNIIFRATHIVQTFKGIKKQASERNIDNLASMQAFNTLLPDIELKDLAAEYINNFVREDELENVMSKDVTSVRDVDYVMENMMK